MTSWGLTKMRLFALSMVALVLMQLPATAAIVSSFPDGLERAQPFWCPTYGCLNWDLADHTVSFSSIQRAGNSESAEFILTTTYSISLDDFGPQAPGTLSSQLLVINSPKEVWRIECGAFDRDVFAGNTAEEDAFFENIRIAGTSVAPEPATLTIWGVTALALAAATYRRQKRSGRTSQQVKAAVKEYLDACTGPSEHFRMLGSYLTQLADDPAWSKQDIEAFYDEVVVALHRRREHAEVA